MRVLIAVQDQAGADALLPFALNYPWPVASTFNIVHVVQPVLVNSYLSLLPAPLTESIAKDRADEGKRLVRHFAIQLIDAWHSPHIQEYVVEGDPAMELLDQIQSLKPDIVLVGSHGRYGMQLLGSVSRHVLSQAPCSVVIVPLSGRTMNSTASALVTHLSDKPSTG